MGRDVVYKPLGKIADPKTITFPDKRIEAINLNYERGDNIALLCFIKETTAGSGTLTGSLLYFLNEVEILSGYARNFTRQNQGGLNITYILDAGAVFLFRQLFVDYYTSSDDTATATLSASEDGITYTTLSTTTYTSGTRIDNLISGYVSARFIRFYISVGQQNLGTATLTLGKIRLIL